MRFASHRDIARAVERGVRRAGLPIAYSAGFTPHPKISYAGAAPTGTASEAEYLELSLTAVRAAAEVRDQLNAALPDGIDVVDVTEEADSLGAMTFEASQWDMVLPGVGLATAAAAAEAFLACRSVEVERLTSKGTRTLDARAAVVTMQAGWRGGAERDAGYAILRMVVRHLTPAVRPDDILTALRRVAGLAPSSPPMVTRLAQGPLEAVAAAAAAGKLQPAAPAGSWVPQPVAPPPAGAQPPAAQPPAARSLAEEPFAAQSFAAERLAAQSIAAQPGGAAPAGAEQRAEPGAAEPLAAQAAAAQPAGGPLPGLGQPGQGAARQHVETTRPGALPAGQAGARQGSACDQLPRGASGSGGAHAPGSLTGDSPDARKRAERHRAQ